MFVYLSKKIAIPNGVKLESVAWNPEQGISSDLKHTFYAVDFDQRCHFHKISLRKLLGLLRFHCSVCGQIRGTFENLSNVYPGVPEAVHVGLDATLSHKGIVHQGHSTPHERGDCNGRAIDLDFHIGTASSVDPLPSLVCCIGD